MNNRDFTYMHHKTLDLDIKINNKTSAIIVDDKISEKPLKYVKYNMNEREILKKSGVMINKKIHMIKKTFDCEIVK